MSDTLHTDPTREQFERATGIFVSAQNQYGRWVSTDIATLDTASLMAWLRSRGGDNPWAEQVVALLLGHEPG